MILALTLLIGCSASSHVERGQAMLDQQRLPEAESEFRAALGREPTNDAALAGLGWTYHLAGEEGAAQSAFVRCAEVAPQRAECLRGQASVSLSKGEVAQARDLLGRALVLAPHDARVQSSQALLELASGDIAAAADRYEALVERFPDAPEYRLGLVEVRLRQHRNEDALQLIEGALASAGLPVRTRAMLRLRQARALVASTAGRLDPARCAQTAPPLRVWLDAADGAVAAADALQVGLPELAPTRRLVERRRVVVDDTCPVGD